jgi:hypothetical protein
MPSVVIRWTAVAVPLRVAAQALPGIRVERRHVVCGVARLFARVEDR